jgi:hypothetical protein
VSAAPPPHRSTRSSFSELTLTWLLQKRTADWSSERSCPPAPSAARLAFSWLASVKRAGRVEADVRLLELGRLVDGDREALRDRLVDEPRAARQVAREQQVGPADDRDVDVVVAHVRQQDRLLADDAEPQPGVVERDGVRRERVERAAQALQARRVRVEQRVARHREQHDVLALDLGERREEVEVRGDARPGLPADLLDLEPHQVPELPVRDARRARVADVHLAPRQPDARVRRLEARLGRLPALGDLLRVQRRRGESRDLERVALPRAAQELGGAQAEVDCR